MEYTLAMTFLTSAGEKSTLSVSGVKTTIAKDEVNTLMDTITSKNIFKNKASDLVKKSGAQVTQRQVTKYEVA